MAAPTLDTDPTRSPPKDPTTPTPTPDPGPHPARARGWSVRVAIGAAIVVGLLGWLLGLALVMVPGDEADGAVDTATPYGTRGPHPVGLRNLDRTETSGSLDLVVWYPAEPTDGDPAMTYPFEFKLFGPLGSVALATAEGHATRGATAYRAAGPYPFVVLSPGFGIGVGSYGWLGEHLASHGFVVVAPDHDEQLNPGQLWRSSVTRPHDVLEVFDLLDEHTAPGGPFEGLIDTDTVAVIGHSSGGYTALAAAGARLHTGELERACDQVRGTGDPVTLQCELLVPHVGDMATLAGLETAPEGLWPPTADPRVDAAVVLAGDAIMFGPTGLAEITIPVMTIGGTADTGSPFVWGTEMAYEHTSSARKAEVSLDGAEHFVFVGPCESVRGVFRVVPNYFCADSGWDRHQAQTAINHHTTAFLLAELHHDTDADAALADRTPIVPGVSYRQHGYPTSTASTDNAAHRSEGE